jgi:AraC-like DNA-binding protein
MDFLGDLMDILTKSPVSFASPMSSLQLREGFAGQDMFVIPRSVLAQARPHPLVRSVYPTDIGWFPAAGHHYRDRPAGAGQDHLMMCIGGHGYAVIDGQEAHLQAGELLIIPRDTQHTYWAAADDPWSIYWVHFLGDEARYYIDRVPRPGQPVRVEPAAQQEAERLFRYCLDALYEGYGMPTLIYAAQSVQHILSLLLYRNHALALEPRKKNRRSSLDLIIEYMQKHMQESLRLEDFAREAGMSVSHFSELFRAQTGQSPMAYFSHVRIRYACRLLDLSPGPVKTVAIECGYRDPYYFSRVFKKVMGMSPEKYREIEKG